MLKLPKGLKKKKKGKKSKKDKELFTEEELEQYKREHQKKELETSKEASVSSTTASGATNDDEWSKFKALTGGVDSILKQKQEDLDRIKSTSFFKRVPPPSEERKKQEEKERKEAIVAEEEKLKARVEEETKKEDIFQQAVVELSESESEEEEVDDIFDTTYIDVIAAAEVGLVNVDSPTEEENDGVDPFDTSYADKVIKGPEVSKRGKKLVSIGSAVEVLTGRVESTTSAVRSRRPRRGPKDLLLETLDAEGVDLDPSPEPIRTLLDDPADDIPDIPVDLSVSLHIALQKEKQKTDEEEQERVDLAEEFGILKQSVDLSEDEFAQLAESSSKKEVHILEKAIVQPTSEGDWAFFDTKGDKPPRSVSGPHIPAAVSDEDISFREDSSDPFDTAFVERILPATLAEDLDFDPRAEDIIPEPEFKNQTEQFPPHHEKKPELEDLFQTDEEHSSKLAHNPLVPKTLTTQAVALSDDPFDTSVIDSIVAPKKTELTLLESELLSNIPQELKHSLSDSDFDPRAEEEIKIKTHQETVSQRKSSLVLNIHPVPSRGVKFAVNSSDLLKTDDHIEGHRKPLTPYYTKESVALPENLSDDSDPFDTSFVSDSKPTDVELNLIERDLLAEPQLKHSLSDQDFDPRGNSPHQSVPAPVKTDLLSANNDFSSKVLTPAVETKTFTSIDHFVDPFDTSNIESNIQPGKVELHLLADEFVPQIEIETDLFDTSRDTNHFFAGKVLTPQPTSRKDSIEDEDIDPFDTSFANNLAPGPSEIRVIETELIDN